ncbi:DUF1843 domain-containing protein [Nannocystis sp.]|uniref:DUF1843 domain-containing protein n=1 Tax=Nannocystis sp. TaxID=1962667 RepID=UPI002423BE9D|nr:DUF1843 domain-containing protein [Nannocystis sp.]MBK7823679.1 DUF1843 domain-containing protein [Nannocystis sp.]MBK9755808.1 DUF1843 domain-containing protein [Nannocystis sp.]
MAARTIRPLYGIPMQQAASSKDAAKMSSLLADAETYIASEAQVRAALPQIERVVGKSTVKAAQPVTAMQPLYAIGDALRKGDPDELAALHAQAVAYLHACDEIHQALPALRKALEQHRAS